MNSVQNNIKNPINSVYQMTNLVKNDYSKIKERKFSKSVRVAKTKTFSNFCF